MKAQKRRRQFYQVGKGKEIPEMDVSRYTECERHSLGTGNIVSKHEIWHLENSALHSPALFHFTSYFLNQLVLSVKFSMTSLGGTCFLILSFLLNGKSSISSLPLYLLRMSNIRLYKLKKKKNGPDLWVVCGGLILVCHFMKIQCQNEETVFPTKKAKKKKKKKKSA